MIVLGIAGYARAGKDTFVSIAKEILTNNGYRPQRFAFADMLKNEVAEMLTANRFSAKVNTEDSDAKKILRPLLVWWGCQRRYESDKGMYWVNEVDKRLNDWDECEARGGRIGSGVALVSDVRFPNESNWVKESRKGEVIHLKRYSISKERLVHAPWETVKLFDPAPNDEELKNDPLVIEMADQKVEWENRGNLPPEKAVLEPYLRGVVYETLNKSKFFNGSLTV